VEPLAVNGRPELEAMTSVPRPVTRGDGGWHGRGPTGLVPWRGLADRVATGADTGLTDSTRPRLFVLALCCLLVAVPFASVHLPPITDLPQHLSQVRLLHEAVADPDGPYRVQWFTPYILSYVPLTLAWALSPGESAGRIAMLILAVLWTVTIHGLAWKRGRAAAAAILACVFFYNHATYWGFYSFAIGWPAFALWFLLTARPPAARFRPRDAALFLGAAALLYLSHALWLAAGIAWFVLRALVARPPIRTALLQAASLAPVVLMAAVWFPQLSAAGFSSPTRWSVTPTGRLSLSWLVDGTLGGLQGPAEYAVAALVAAWIALGVHQHRGRLREAVDRDLCLAAALFAALAIVLPNLHQNTIAFASRWTPIAVIVLLLGLPAPAWRRAQRNATALAALAVFALATAVAWTRVERDEYAGLPESLAALPPNTRVIGLDYVKTSAFVKGRPFLQGFAYAQVARGSQLNFSFAEFAPMAVVYRTPRRTPWTRGLEWYAERLTPSDLDHFDYALVNADARRHASLATLPELVPSTLTGRWRLYRIRVPGP
jgi:hypothetical protein